LQVKRVFPIDPFKTTSYTPIIVPNPNEATPLPTLDAGLIYRDQLQTEGQPQAPNPDNPVWGIGGALLIWVVTILLQAIIPALLLIPYAARRLNPNSPNFAREFLEFAATDRSALFLQVFAILPSHVLIFALLWAFVTRFGKRPFLASLGWGWSGRLRSWGSVGLGVALFAAATALVKLLGAEKPTQLELLINSSIAARYMIAALAVFTAPFVEEFIYRGVLYSALQRTIGVRGAVVFVLALFTLIHVPQYWPNLGVIAAVGLLSIVLTVVRAQTGRLLPCVLIHLVFNLIQAVILILEPYAQRMLPTSQPAPTFNIRLLLTGFFF
jgi:membrane protease YdiL (CAAX protease family)